MRNPSPAPAQPKSFAEIVSEVVESFFAAFLLILSFSVYRAARGVPLSRLSSEIIAGYPKFFLFFFAAAAALYFLFIFLLRRRGWLDLLIAALSVFVLIGWIAFSVKTDSADEARLIAWIGAAYLCHYLFNVRGMGSKSDLSARAAGGLLTAAGALTLCLTAATGIVRHRIFLTSDFDLGIFDQMFYLMSRGGAPITTSVGYAMNHMLEIHFSPIFYLLVPIYKLRSSPETLLFLQSLFATLAVVPLYRLARAHHLDRKTSLILAVLFLLQPGYFGGQLKDFHEIKLLPVFFLSFIYFFERNEDSERFLDVPTVVFLILTLAVKEDAAIYVIAYAMTALFRSVSARKKAIVVILIAGLVFVGITGFILGDESDFTYRYRSLLPAWETGSIGDLAKVLITSPFAILTRVFTPEKLKLYSFLLLPLALLPLFGARRLKNLSLLLPFIAFNLLQDLEWQAIDSQYFMGPISCFLILVISELEAIRTPSRRFALSAFMLLATVLFSLSAHLPKTDYFHKYRAEAAVYGELEKELSAIPAELSASGASHFYSHLSRRAEIYPTAFEYETDVIAIDLRDSKVPGLYENVLRWIRSDSAYGARSYRRDYWVILEKGLESDETQVVIDEMEYLTQ